MRMRIVVLFVMLVGAVFALSDSPPKLEAFDVASPKNVLSKVLSEGAGEGGKEEVRSLGDKAGRVLPLDHPEVGAALSALGVDSVLGGEEARKEPIPDTGSSVSSGSHTVTVNDADGSLSVSVPIEVPVGANGAQPLLAFKYNSNNGENHVGVGWKLMGVSAVHRCSRTKSQDGANEPIEYITPDGYCLDGSRLICVSGTYGEDGSSYRTEDNTWVNVLAHGTTPTGPSSWSVMTKVGQTRTYSSLVNTPANLTRAWSITDATDIPGNKVTFSYLPGGAGEIVLSAISSYAASDLSEPHSEISFGYTQRSDLGGADYFTYVGKGGLTYNTELLTSVSTKTKGGDGGAWIPVYVYKLTYSVSDDNTAYVSSITQCFGSGEEGCNQPYAFTYTSKSGGSYNYTNDNNPSFDDTFTSLNSYEELEIQKTKLGDFNGDGLQDIFKYNGDYGGVGETCDVWLAVGDNNGGVASYTHVQGPSLPALSTVFSQAQVTLQRVVVLDWNNDGCTDVYIINNEGGNDSVFLFQKATNTFISETGPQTGRVFSSNPSESSLDISRYKFSDFNGDGFQDLFYIPGDQGDSNPPDNQVYLNNNNGTYKVVDSMMKTPLAVSDSAASYTLNQIKFVDLNADSVTDLYVINMGNTADTIYLGSTSGVFSTISGPVTPISSVLTQASTDLQRVQFGDINGDGFQDIYFITGDNSAGNDLMWFFDGASTWTYNDGLQGQLFVGSYASSAKSDLTSIKFMDLSADKGTDIYQLVAGGYDNIYYSKLNGDFAIEKGKGADTPISTTNVQQRENDVSRALFGDLNGDGVTDIYWINGAPGVTKTDILRLAPNRRGFMTAVDTPLGIKTDIQFQPLTNTNVYTRGTNAVFPLIDYQGARYVVSQVTKPGGDMSSQVTMYTYEYALNHQQGWGFLGYQYVNTLQQRTGLTMRTQYSQDYENHLQYHILEKWVNSSSTNIYQEITDYLVTKQTYSGKTLYNIQTASKTDIKNDLNGGLLGKTDDVYLYDQYNNVLSSTSEQTDTLGTDFIFEVDHTYYYDSDLSLWDVSRRLTTTRQKYYKSTPGDKSEIQIINTYNTNKQVVEQCASSLSPSDNGENLCVSLTLDINGNRVKTVVSGQNYDGSAYEANSFTTSYAGDKFGRLPTSTTNPLGKTQMVEYDYRCGMVSKSTTPLGSGNTSFVTISYNDFCMGEKQVFRSTSPGSVVSTVTYLLCSVPETSCPSTGMFAVETVGGNNVVTWNYFNSFEQLVRTMTVAYLGTSNQKYISDIQYGANDEVSQASTPYLATVEGGTVTGSPTGWFKYEYDILDRLTTITYPNGNNQSTTYNGTNVITTNANGQKMTTVTNVLKQIIHTMDAQNNQMTFTYSPRGDLIMSTDPSGYSVEASFDGFGNRLTVTDANMGGTTKITTDVLGNELKRVTPAGYTFIFEYDQVGRPLGRTSTEGSYDYVYDSDTEKLTSVTFKDAQGNLLNQEIWQYDSLSRPIGKQTDIFSNTFITNTTYDTYSRVVDTTFPSGLSVTNHYDSASGYLSYVTDTASGQKLVEIDSMSPSADITELTLYGWLKIQKTFDIMGRLTRILSTDISSGKQYQNLSYTWDGVNNLLSRTDNIQSLTETFTYDDLNRLVTSTSPSHTSSLTYDVNGNILSNSDEGSYVYDSSAPHRVVKLTGKNTTKTYSYDAAGNVLSASKGSSSVTLQYFSFNKPSSINDGSTGKTYNFVYGNGLQMIQRTCGEITTSYGDFWEYEDNNGQDYHRSYVGQYFSEIYNPNTNQLSKYAILRDHLGSVDKIVDLEYKGIMNQQSYTFSGAQRDPLTWKPQPDYTPPATYPNVTQGGFTNQNEMPQENLVHMGGRLYDSAIMRFYSADPYNPPVGNLQGLNKYSYVMNRPLSDSDPTGYKHHAFKHFFHKFLKTVLKIIKWAIDAVLLIACEGPECAALFNVAFDIVKDKIEGEGWKGSLLDGASTFLSWEIAGGVTAEMSADEVFARHVAVGLVQGTDAKAHGGSFVTGFIGGYNFNPYDNPLLKPGSAAGTAEFESVEQLQQKLMAKIDHTIANQLGVPYPVVHTAQELVVGDKTIDFKSLSTSISNSIDNLGSISFPKRPFDLIDPIQALSGQIALSGVQALSTAVSTSVTTMMQQGPTETTAIVNIGFFRGTIPVAGIPEELPGGLPGGNPYLGGYINVQFAPLGISVQADARVSPGAASYGVFVGSNNWNVYAPVKKGSTNTLFSSESPTAKSNDN